MHHEPGDSGNPRLSFGVLFLLLVMARRCGWLCGLARLIMYSVDGMSDISLSFSFVVLSRGLRAVAGMEGKEVPCLTCTVDVGKVNDFGIDGTDMILVYFRGYVVGAGVSIFGN
ncbi:hypothetical protein B0J18DRAFT_112707 [Chaetomium sp. MPI-SDFR-AT-0129]|nr:hypothetical protein B0J18DRAFT_112707 [Chaetomium sp. MPI-SDFR-AT-0129]